MWIGLDWIGLDFINYRKCNQFSLGVIGGICFSSRDL